MPRMTRRTNRGGVRPGAGAPQKEGEDVSKSTRQRRVRRVREQMERQPYARVAKAFIQLTRAKRGNKVAACVRKSVFVRVPSSRRNRFVTQNEATQMLTKFKLQEPTPLTNEEALALVLFENLGKRTYCSIRKMVNKAAKVKLMPTYNHVRASKIQCRPTAGIRVTEVKSEVAVQNILNHTLSRLVQLNGPKIDEQLGRPQRNHPKIKCLFTASYGFDGASGQSIYQRKYDDPNNRDRTDGNLFAATFNPLDLQIVNGESLWRNEVPQSPLCIRPLIFEFERESLAYVEE